MIVFQIHCNFFIVLPIRLKTYRSNVFLFFIRQIGRAQKLGPNSSRPVWRCLWEKLTYFKKSISFFGWFVWSSFEKLEWVERITKIFIIIVIAANTAITFWIIFYHYPIKANLQVWRYFNPIQAALWCMLSDCPEFTEVKWSDMNNMKMMSKDIGSPISLTYPSFCIGFWDGAKHSRILKNSPPSYLLTGITTVLLQRQSIMAS